MKLTAHFTLEEYAPGFAPGELPEGVLSNIEAHASHLAEPARVALGVPITITSGYRPAKHNAEVGGVHQSDHEFGKAADLQAHDGDDRTWEDNTRLLARWLRDNKHGDFGQLILEDHREHYKRIGAPTWHQKLWVHVSLKTVKHPGDELDGSRLLLSVAPGIYRHLADDDLA